MSCRQPLNTLAPSPWGRHKDLPLREIQQLRVEKQYAKSECPMKMLLSKKPMAFPKTKTSEDVFKAPSKNEEKQLQARNTCCI